MFHLAARNWHIRSWTGDVNIIVSFSVITGIQEPKLKVLEAHSNSYEPP